MRHKILDFLKYNWERWSLGDKPEQAQFLLLNFRTINFVIFKKNQKNPVLLVKVSKNYELKKEFDNLLYINPLLPDNTPRPYAFEKISDHFILVQSFMTGKSISFYSNVRDLINRSIEQLINFHRLVRKNNLILNEKQFQDLFIEPINRYLTYNNSKLIKRECNYLIKEVEKLRNIEFPVIPQHCDFSFANLLFRKNKVNILDWEDFGRTNLPLYDLFTLIISMYLESNLFENFMEHSFINNIFKNKIINYCDNFNINKEFVEFLFPITLIKFFTQYFPCRLKTSEMADKLIQFYFLNKEKFFISSIFDK